MKDYERYLKIEEDRKLKARLKCVHSHWRKICSTCGATLESEHIHEEPKQEEIPIN